jgi:hypothetical protein
MKIARIIMVALVAAFSAGVVLSPWTPASAEDSSSGGSKSKKKTKSAQNQKKNDKGTGSQTSGSGTGGSKPSGYGKEY